MQIIGLSKRYSFVLALGVAAAVWMPSGGAVQAQSAAPAAVTTFLGDPSQLLTQNPTGGGRLVAQVRDLLMADPSTLSPLLALLAGANPAQKAAIGSGLAQVARLQVRTNEQFAGQIQQSVANTRDQEVIVAFAAAAGDRPLGGIGAGPGGGAGAASGGAVGGQINPLPMRSGATGPATPIGGPGVATGQFTYSSSVIGATGVSRMSSSVSP